MKTKISFNGRFTDHSFEGLMKITSSLMKGLSKNYDIVQNKDESAKLINIHASGFSEGLKIDNKGGKKIYSLHSNFGMSIIQELKDFRDYYKYIIDKNSDYFPWHVRLIKQIYRLISILTPLFLKKLILSKNDRVIVANNYMRTYLNLKNCVVINQGVDIIKFNSKNLNNAHKSIKSVAYFGHLAPSKGILEVVIAFSKLDELEKNIFVTKITPKFKKWVRDIDPTIKLHGPQKNIARAYKSQDLIVLPLRHVGSAIATPLVLIEAMACKVSVVVSDLPHIKEYCKDSVYYCKPNSPQSIVDAILSVKKDNLVSNKKKQKARKIVENYFDEKIMIKKYAELYEELL